MSQGVADEHERAESEASDGDRHTLHTRDGHPKGDSIPLREALKITVDASWGLVTIVIIIGGILLGIFTAIEAGAMACVWAFFVTMFIYRDYRWRDLPALVHRTLKTVAMAIACVRPQAISLHRPSARQP